MKPWMRLHIGTDTLQKPSDVQKGDGRMKIKKMILFILFIAVIFSLTGCGKSYEKKIEEKYGIEIEGADNDTLKIIDEYFSKLPKGFVEELKKYEGIDDRKIFIKINDEKGMYDFSSDIAKGDYWTIGASDDMDMGLGYCTMYSIWYNVTRRKDTDGILEDWDSYNPVGFQYGDSDTYSKYAFSENNYENAYFISDGTINHKLSDMGGYFAVMMRAGKNIESMLEQCPKIRAKAEYLCKEIERAFNTVDENAYWNSCFGDI